MAQVESSSAKCELAETTNKRASVEKRKLEADSDDELFFAYESSTKLKKIDDSTAAEVKKDVKLEEKEKEKKEPKESAKEEKESTSSSNKKVEDDKSNNKENSKPIVNSPAAAAPKVAGSPFSASKPTATAINSPFASKPSTAVNSPKPNNKFMIQQKLAFSPSVTKSPASSSSSEAKPVVPKPIVRANGEWFIEDYLVDEQWRRLLADEFEKPYFKEINAFIKPGYEKGIVRPPKELVFNALNSTKINNIKVVIIGQDPYHDDGQAHGLSFSVPKGIALPPSLRNIFTELKNDIPTFKRNESLGGCLQKWANEGVFMLNAFLTVEAHKPASHSKIGWDHFTDRVIKVISEKNNGCAFLLWGNFAQKKESLIDKKKHSIIKSAHPSPFSVTRFFGSKPFSQANTFLKSIGKTPVNWDLV